MPLLAREVGYLAAGFSDHEGSGGKVPGSRAIVQERVAGSGGHISDIRTCNASQCSTRRKQSRQDLGDLFRLRLRLPVAISDDCFFQLFGLGNLQALVKVEPIVALETA